ncbi:hypothetical protein DFH09DRAFT_1186064, partial [Mycena vulgaris]
MSHTISPQQEAEGLIEDITQGHHDTARYKWPDIDYEQVSTPTCRTVLDLIDGGNTKYRGYDTVTPETPRKERIARQIDSVLADRIQLVKKRKFMAQNLDDSLNKNLKFIFTFLRAARRSDREQINFPHSPETLMQSLASAQRALAEVAEMVHGNTDLDET